MKRLLLLTIACLGAGCNGGSSTGGGSIVGPTPHSGVWNLSATINVIVGGTATAVSHTSTIEVQPTGTALIQETDTDCALSVAVAGDILTYEEQCVFATENAPCTLKLQSTARISGDGLAGPFGPKTEVCSGVATSYSGNLLGTREESAP